MQFSWFAFALLLAPCSAAMQGKGYVINDKDDGVTLRMQMRSSGELNIQGTVLSHNQFTYDEERDGENDIALIRLHTAVELSDSIQPICLPRGDDRVAVDDDMTAVGWGLQIPLWSIKNISAKDELLNISRQKTYLKQLSFRAENATKCVTEITTYHVTVITACQRNELPDTFCELFHDNGDYSDPEKYNWDSSNRMICGIHRLHSAENDAQKRVTCYGDSGGPLMKQRPDGAWVVVGIISMGIRCCLVYMESHPQTGDLFTDVLSHRDWIHSSMQWFDELFNECAAAAGQTALLSLTVISVLLTSITNATW